MVRSLLFISSVEMKEPFPIPPKPGSPEFDAKLERARQLLEEGRLREALDLALEALQEEIRRLHASFQALRRKMGREPRPRPTLEPQDQATPPAAKKNHHLH